MDRTDTTNILSFVSKFFEENVAVINFEMINPNDPFGQTMVMNLEDRGCQLLSINDIPNEQAQEERMSESGFTYSYCENMLRVHNCRLDDKERERIEKIEIFDEFEEWDLLQTHYCICIGSKFQDNSEFSF